MIAIQLLPPLLILFAGGVLLTNHVKNHATIWRLIPAIMILLGGGIMLVSRLMTIAILGPG